MNELCCLFCFYNGIRVLDLCLVDEGCFIWRRRECESCLSCFMIFERVEELFFIVVKKEGIWEEFNKEKILCGLIKVCEKRLVFLR